VILSALFLQWKGWGFFSDSTPVTPAENWFVPTVLNLPPRADRWELWYCCVYNVVVTLRQTYLRSPRRANALNSRRMYATAPAWPTSIVSSRKNRFIQCFNVVEYYYKRLVVGGVPRSCLNKKKELSFFSSGPRRVAAINCFVKVTVHGQNYELASVRIFEECGLDALSQYNLVNTSRFVDSFMYCSDIGPLVILAPHTTSVSFVLPYPHADF